ncbi:MAG TPA: ROK family protein, partial [Thermoanaerobaculia bacterium]|nr:ROK family protein [Thermoanaerobaculia bacterium]
MAVLAFDLGGTKLAAALINPKGEIRDRIEEPVDKDDPIAQMVRITEQKEFDAIGVAVPGLVRRDGTVWAPNLPGWDAVPLAKALRKKLRVDVSVES